MHNHVPLDPLQVLVLHGRDARSELAAIFNSHRAEPDGQCSNPTKHSNLPFFLWVRRDDGLSLDRTMLRLVLVVINLFALFALRAPLWGYLVCAAVTVLVARFNLRPPHTLILTPTLEQEERWPGRTTSLRIPTGESA